MPPGPAAYYQGDRAQEMYTRDGLNTPIMRKWATSPVFLELDGAPPHHSARVDAMEYSRNRDFYFAAWTEVRNKAFNPEMDKLMTEIRHRKRPPATWRREPRRFLTARHPSPERLSKGTTGHARLDTPGTEIIPGVLRRPDPQCGTRHQRHMIVGKRGLSARVRNLARREAIECYLFISPVCIGLLAFTIGPILASFYFSFTEYNIIRPPKRVGLRQFRDLMHDELFWQSLKVTGLYVVMHLPLSLVLALGIALLMNQKVRGIVFFRTVYYLPSVISGVAVALLWMWICNPEFGILNTLLAFVNIQGPAWLFDEHWSLPAIAIMSLWGVGGQHADLPSRVAEHTE